MFAIVDCNNFYASCERLFNPKLEFKPIVVLSNNDGCVIARSNEAKALGIPMGATAYKYKQLLYQNKVQVFSSNFALYGDMSSRVMNTLTNFTPDIEIYSIDEAFLQFNGFDKHFDLYTYGLEIGNTVRRNTGIQVGIGIAPTKALSKVANRIAKKFPEKTKGVYVIDTEEKRIKALKWLKIEDVWGIGRKHSKRLNAKGITTAYEFSEMSDEWVKKHLSVVGIRLKRELQGISVLKLEDVPSPKKNIATTRSFAKNYKTYDEVKERVVAFANTCATKLRKQNSCCNALMVFILTNYHRKDLPQYSRNIVVKLPHSMNSSFDIAHFATTGLKKIFKEGYAYKKAGVIVLDIVPENPNQLALFSQVNPKHQLAMQCMDKLNDQLGQSKVKLGAQDLGRVWKMKQEHLSQRYTTRLDEIIKIKL